MSGAGLDAARRYGWQAIAAATSSVIAFSAVRGIGRGYVPIGDNALIELRGRDVLTGDHPFLGTWSSASISSGIDINHPGPLLFNLVAGAVNLLGGGAGIALTVAALHIAIVWLVGIVTSQVGGTTSAVAAQVITAGLVWMLGSELLFDPWQPNVLVLPFWLVICSIWAVVAGEVGTLPLAVGAGSFVMQTHLSYLFIVPILLGFALGAALIQRRHLGPGRFADLRQPVARSAIVAGVLWAQPMWEQFFVGGRGNITRIMIAGTGGGDGPTVESTSTGFSVALRVLGSVLALPPWWGRSGYDDSIPGSTWIETEGGRELSAPGLRALAPSVVGLIVLGAIIALAWIHVRRIGAPALVAGFQTLAVAGGVATLTVIITPIDVLGLSPHKVRWLWVIGAFSTYLLLMTVLASVRADQRRGMVVALFAVAAITIVASLPTHVNRSGPVYFRETYESIDDIRSQLDDYFDTPGAPSAVMFDAEGIGFAEPYTAPVMAELLRNGVDLVVADTTLARQLGPDRRLSADESSGVRSLVFVRAGNAATIMPDGAERIAFHDGDRSDFNLDDVTDRAVAVFVVKEPS